MNILVIEDDITLLELVKTFLEGKGHDVTVTTRAKEALKLLDEKKPDLVLLDIQLPDQNGLDTLSQIKSRFFDLSVVIMTGFKDAEVVVQAFRRGALDCLLKPLNLDYLQQSIISRVQKSS
ncbi:MAG TPA: response regulator [Elusimicrobiota bacterium]|nr:response regulator [Elusimicrobiota bacterium]